MLRVWTLDRQGAIVGQRRSDRGMGRLSPADFGPNCRPISRLWMSTVMFRCRAWPAPPRDGRRRSTSTFRAILPLLPAPRSRSPGSSAISAFFPAWRSATSPARMSRGEETILYGLVCQGIEAGLVRLPGTHAKWARVRDSRLTDFRTFMTGELTNSLPRDPSFVIRWRWQWSDRFRRRRHRGLRSARKSVDRVARAAGGPLLFGQDSQTGAARLSGLLIGANSPSALRRMVNR